jgi:hypothetical protein
MFWRANVYSFVPMGTQHRKGVAYGVTSGPTNRNTVTKAGRCYINNNMAAHKRYRNSDARAHIKVQMRSAEIPAY